MLMNFYADDEMNEEPDDWLMDFSSPVCPTCGETLEEDDDKRLVCVNHDTQGCLTFSAEDYSSLFGRD
jgi:hypothetical protein